MAGNEKIGGAKAAEVADTYTGYTLTKKTSKLLEATKKEWFQPELLNDNVRFDSKEPVGSFIVAGTTKADVVRLSAPLWCCACVVYNLRWHPWAAPAFSMARRGVAITQAEQPRVHAHESLIFRICVVPLERCARLSAPEID